MKVMTDAELIELRKRLVDYGDKFPPNDHENDCLSAAFSINELVKLRHDFDALKCELRDADDALAETQMEA